VPFESLPCLRGTQIHVELVRRGVSHLTQSPVQPSKAANGRKVVWRNAIDRRLDALNVGRSFD
jgi:hypothetical protein